MADIERRVIDKRLKLRAADGEPTTLEGYASVFNQEITIGP